MRAPTQGVLLALVGAILFGLVSVAARASQLPALTRSAYAYLLAGVLLAATLRGLRIQKRDWPRILTMSLLGGALAPILLFYGLDQARATDASVLLTLEMVFTAILAALFLRERARAQAWIGIALLFASAIIIAIRSSAPGGETTIVGASLVALAALAWGIDNTVSAQLVGSAAQQDANTSTVASSTYKPHHLLALKGLIGGAVALTAAIAMQDSLAIPRTEILTIAYIGILGVGASILCFYHALQRIGATLTASLFLPATAIAGVLGGWLLLGERLDLAHAAAAAIAVLGIILIARAPAPR